MPRFESRDSDTLNKCSWTVNCIPEHSWSSPGFYSYLCKGRGEETGRILSFVWLIGIENERQSEWPFQVRKTEEDRWLGTFREGHSLRARQTSPFHTGPTTVCRKVLAPSSLAEKRPQDTAETQRNGLLLLTKQGFSLHLCPVTELDETVSVILILFQVSSSKRKVLVYVDS